MMNSPAGTTTKVGQKVHSEGLSRGVRAWPKPRAVWMQHIEECVAVGSEREWIQPATVSERGKARRCGQ